MGQIVKQIGEGTTRYFWYPGDKKEWYRAVLAAGLGALTFGLIVWWTGSMVASVTTGTALTAGVLGANFGRRDFRAAHGFAEPFARSAARAAIVHGSRAAWRGAVQGCGGAGAAVLIVNLPGHGFLADWVLPVVPAVVGALGHQAGMVYERLAQLSTPQGLPPIPARS
jgi:hypothetical protein